MLFKGKKTLLASLLVGALAGGSYTALADEATKEYIEILVDGAGLDKESAMNNAYQNAVKQAVGLYIDAETLIDNNQEVKDKILTHSRGIIDKVEVISDQNDDGIYRVEILAQVIKQELEEKVKPISSDKASFNIDGESLVAAKASKEQQEADAKAILEEIALYIKEESINWIDFTIDGSPRVSNNHDYVEVDVLATYDFDKYLSIMEKPIEMLEQIALSKTQAVTQAENMNSPIPFRGFSSFPSGNYFLIEKWKSNNHQQRKWTFYELPINCDLDLYKIPSFRTFSNNRKITINVEIKSKDNETISLGFKNLNDNYNISQAYYKNCAIAHDIKSLDDTNHHVFFTQKPIKTTIRIPIEPNQIADIDSVEISVN